MPAPDYETLFDVETAVEAAANIILAAAPYSFVTVESQRNGDLREYPRADVQFAQGTEQGHRSPLADGSGDWVADAWHGILTISVQTTRPPADDVMAHTLLRSRARIAAQYFKDQFNANVLPYHVLTMIRQAGTEQTVESETDIDKSAIHFECVVSIRPGSFPLPDMPTAIATEDQSFPGSPGADSTHLTLSIAANAKMAFRGTLFVTGDGVVMSINGPSGATGEFSLYADGSGLQEGTTAALGAVFTTVGGVTRIDFSGSVINGSTAGNVLIHGQSGDQGLVIQEFSYIQGQATS